MRQIEVHILQSFPVSCLNRDDVGSPKTAIFGGVKRGRISSQCLKRAIRFKARELEEQLATEEPRLFTGIRTLRTAEDLRKELSDQKVESPDPLAQIVCRSLLQKKASADEEGDEAGREEADGAQTEESGGETSTLLYLSPGEIKAIAEAISKVEAPVRTKALETPPPDDKNAKNAVQKAVKALKQVAAKAARDFHLKDAADIAIFGRMAANEPSLTLDGAGLFGHALTTHKAANDFDFWTAVDDRKEREEGTGAANMSTAEFTSGVFYRYFALNLDLLFREDHLGFISDAALRQRLLETFLRAALIAVPSARQTSMNAHCEVCYALGLYRPSGQPVQLVNAFEDPIRPRSGLLVPSIRAMLLHHGRMKEFLDSSPELELATGTRMITPEKEKADDGEKLEASAIPPRVKLGEFCTQLAAAATKPAAK